MLGKIKVIVTLISLSVCLCLMSSTYSRYVSDISGNVEISLAKWQILVNNNDITNNQQSSISFTPVIEENEYVANNYFAPSSQGYFDIEIDPSNVDVSFKYLISLDPIDENIPDIIISSYSILPYEEEETLIIQDLENNTITDNLLFDNSIESFSFQPFTIRIYFKWYNDLDKIMSDEEDSEIGYLAAVEDLTFNITATIDFEQIINQ